MEQRGSEEVTKWNKGGVKEMKGVKEEQNGTKKERKKRINEG